MVRPKRVLIPLILIMLLSALVIISCGGGGSGSSQAPPDPPAAPEIQTLTNSDDGPVLTWRDPSGTADGFRVYRGTAPDDVNDLVTTLFSDSGSAGQYRYLDRTVTALATYHYRVRAFNGAGDSDFSTTANLSVPAPPSPPPANPVQIFAFPNNTTSAWVAWSDPSGSGNDGFELLRGNSPDTINTSVASLGGDSTQYTDTGLASDATYYYRVRSHAGGISSWSAAAELRLWSAPINWDLTLSGVLAPAGSCLGTLDAAHAWSASATETGLNVVSFSSTAGTTVLTYGNQGPDRYFGNLQGFVRHPVHGLITLNPLFGSFASDWSGLVLSGNFGTAVERGGCAGPVTVTLVPQAPAVPADPSGLAASALSESLIRLIWVDNSDNETGFRVYRGTTPASLSLVGETGIGSTVFNDGGLQPNTTYYYQVRSHNAGGQSGASNTASATTDSLAGTGPEAPDGLVAAASPPRAAGLSWVDRSSDEEYFRIYRGTSLTSMAFLGRTRGANVTTYLDQSVPLDTALYYYVTAFNGSGESPPTNVVTVTLSSAPDLPPAPSGLAANPLSASEVALTWVDGGTGEDGFNIYASCCGQGEGLVKTVGANATSATLSGLSGGTLYQFRVRSFNSAGESTGSATASATTPPSGGGVQSGTFTATYDNQVIYNSSDSTYENNSFPFTEISVGNNWQYGAFGGYFGVVSAATLLYFDIDATIAGRTVHSAVLRLYPNILPADDNTTYGVNPLTRSWDPLTVTFVNAPNWYDVPNARVIPTFSTSVPLEWDITAIVQDWADGVYPNYGLMVWDETNTIPAQTAYRSTIFDSLDVYFSPDRRPQIVLEWE